jgi:hypothetical protein
MSTPTFYRLIGKPKTWRTSIVNNAEDIALCCVIAAAVMGLVIGFLAILDVSGDEGSTVNGAIIDGSASIDYLPWLIALFVPVVVAGITGIMYLSAAASKNMVRAYSNQRDKFDQFSKKEGYEIYDVKAIWIGGIQHVNDAVMSLGALRKNEDSMFSDSFARAELVARTSAEHIANTFVYFTPVLDLIGAKSNGALLSATERMHSEVTEVKTLVECCSKLFVTSYLDGTHAAIVRNEVENIVAKIEAVEEIDGRALTTGS